MKDNKNYDYTDEFSDIIHTARFYKCGKGMSITAKGRGKSGGARIITYNALITEQEGKIYLLLIYDKADASNIKMNVAKQISKDLGL